jgi:hypothetical protein
LSPRNRAPASVEGDWLTSIGTTGGPLERRGM